MKNTFPFIYQFLTSCTHYIHFRFVFSKGATQFKKFLSFNAPYGGSNGSNNTFPSQYQLPTSCTHYIHFQFAFLWVSPIFTTFFLSTILMKGQMVQIIPSCPNTNFLLPVHTTFTSGLRFQGVPPNLKSFFLSTLLIECQMVQIIPSHPNINFLLPVHATFTSRLHFCGFCQFLRLSFNGPYGGSSGSNNTFPSQYQVPTSCTRYIHFRFAFLGVPPIFTTFFLSTLFKQC